MKKDNKSFISILAKDYSLSTAFFSTIIFFGLLGFILDKYFKAEQLQLEIDQHYALIKKTSIIGVVMTALNLSVDELPSTTRAVRKRLDFERTVGINVIK